MTKRKDERRPPGAAKFKPSNFERQQVITGAAAGLSENRIAKSIGRSRKMVHDVLAKPETQAEVSIEKAKLAEIYKQKARDIVVSINDEDIDKASLQQKAVSSGILLDKSLLLSGEPTEILAANVGVLLNVVEAIKASRAVEQEAIQRSLRSNLPPVIEAAPAEPAKAPLKTSQQPASQDEPEIHYYPVPLKAPDENG